MQAFANPIPAEQHDPEETRLQEERGQHLIGQQRPGDAAGELGVGTPVGAELVRHDDSRHHTHAEIDREYLQPEVVQVAIDLLPGLQPEPLEHGEKAGEPDGDRREDDVKGDGESELDARQL